MERINKLPTEYFSGNEVTHPNLLCATAAARFKLFLWPVEVLR